MGVAAAEKPPSLATWRKLYNSLARFQELACWTWISDADLFAVQDPVSGGMGYCCVMGQEGLMVGLAVYLGNEGLASYDALARARSRADQDEAGRSQKCLMASFGDRRLLDQQDLDVIKSLGLKFRGAQAWPWFRIYLPGYVPLHLNQEQADFLQIALEQTLDVTVRAMEDPGFLSPGSRDVMLARMADGVGGKALWRDTHIITFLPERSIGALPVDEVALKRIRATVKRTAMTWEVGLSYLPMQVNEGGRPFYPSVLLCVDRESGFVFPSDVMRPEERREASLKLLEAMKRSKVLPAEIAVAKDELLDLLQPAATALGTKISKQKGLKMLQRARTALEKGLR